MAAIHNFSGGAFLTVSKGNYDDVGSALRELLGPDIFMDDFPSEAVSGPSPFQRT